MTPPSRRVVLVGAGGFGRETAGFLSTLDAVEPLGFLDDAPSLKGRTFSGLEVLGPLDLIETMPPDVRVVITLGNPRDPTIRRRVAQRLELPDDRYETLIHPMAAIGTDVDIGVGTVVHAGSVFTHSLTIGRHVAIMPNVVLTHDDVVGDNATFGAGVMLAGGVTVEDAAYLGAGVTVREGARIGAAAVVGMGSVVLTDIPSNQVWAGVPARRLH